MKVPLIEPGHSQPWPSWAGVSRRVGDVGSGMRWSKQGSLWSLNYLLVPWSTLVRPTCSLGSVGVNCPWRIEVNLTFVWLWSEVIYNLLFSFLLQIVESWLSVTKLAVCVYAINRTSLSILFLVGHKSGSILSLLACDQLKP